jgi:hypothetical protein
MEKEIVAVGVIYLVADGRKEIAWWMNEEVNARLGPFL